MAAPAPLNAEPTQPEERKKQHLPPKSYADAVEQEASTNGSNGTTDVRGGTNGTNGAGNNGSIETGHMASVLRIVDTGAPATKERQVERPQFERQESKHEYSATVSLFSFFHTHHLLTTVQGPRRHSSHSSSIQTSENWIQK